MDAQVANELMVRIGDAHAPRQPVLQRPYRDGCMTSLRATIMAVHGVTRSEFHAAERARIWWADILFVFAPVGILAAFAMDRITRRVRRSFEAEDRAIAVASIVLLAPVVAAVSLGVANFWSVGVEEWRLRSSHVSHRAFLIPVITHAWTAFAIALAVCFAVAAWRFIRTPSGVARASQYQGGRAFASSRGKGA
jgi:hypothetical protein